MNLAVALTLDVTAGGFVALALAVIYKWYRERGRATGMLAASLVSLGIVAGLGRFQDASHPNALLSIVTVEAFVASAYFVLLFRNEFIPVPAVGRIAAKALLGVSLLVGLALPTVFAHAPRPVVTALGFEVVGAWAIFIGEPIVRFWLASRRLPAVQKARLRFLSFGFAVLTGILIADVVGGAALQSPTAVIVTQLVALATVPFIYFSFAPPTILRRIWRMSEEDKVRAAMQDLLIFSPTRKVMAERAVFWAVRLVGATSGLMVDPEGRVMATAGMDAAEAARIAAESRAGGSIIKAPLHLSEGEGSLMAVAGRFTPVFGSDEISQFVAYANSVTAGLERARVTERMAALENSKTQFLNLASHELRAPLTVIRGYVSMMNSGLFGDLNERGRTAGEVMTAKVAEMNDLIEQMMDAARLEEGALVIRAVEADLRDIATAAVDVVKPMLDRSHRIVLDLPERRVRVTVDPERTQTILTNLLTNALKYSPSGGDITVQVRSTRAGVAKIAVTDEGMGISRDDLPKLFTRFGRIITPDTEHLRGTGLGLFLSRQLARLQGGDITVVSTPGKGSTFTLQLPTEGAAAQPTAGQNGAGAEAAAEEQLPSH